MIGDEPANTRKLYLKVKEEPTLLYDKIYRDDILAHAYHLAKAN